VVTTKTIDSGIGTSQVYLYDYIGNPQYLGSSWNQKFRGFNQVKEIDGDGNYILHYYYTTGTINGQDAEKLTGREYRTQWYQLGAPDILIRQMDYTWECNVTEEEPGGDFIEDIAVTTPWGIGISTDGFVYVASYNDDKIEVYDEYSGYQYEDINGLDDPRGIDVSTDGYVYVADYANDRIAKFLWSGICIDEFPFTDPIDVAVGPDGTVYATSGYISNNYNHYVYKFNSDGSSVPAFQFDDAYGLDVASNGDFYITSLIDNHVVRLDLYGVDTHYDNYTDPIDVTVDDDGYIYISSGVTTQVSFVK
jgi:hypothetical protein